MEHFVLPLLIVCVFILLPLSVKDAIKSYRMWELHQKMGECDGKIVKVLKEIPCVSERAGLPVVAMKYKYKVEYQVNGSTYYGAYYLAGDERQIGDIVHLRYVLEHHTPHLLQNQRER